MYHSVALLMPDGRVLTASGNPPPYGQRAPWQPPQPNEEMRIEIYSPPYLFGPARPTIGQVATEWHYGQPADISTPDAGSIMWAEIIRYGVTTHAFDNSQRLVDLPITGRPAGGLTVNAPAAPTIAPPGWYMLFLVNQQQIPSVATPIHLS
jgi:Galactose oxidase-like, Early set domain